MNGLVPANPQQSDMGYVGGQAAPVARAEGAAAGRWRNAACAVPGTAGQGAAAAARRAGSGRVRRVEVAAAAAQPCRGCRLSSRPYDRITAYNMNTGDIVWQKTHSRRRTTSRTIPRCKGLNLPRLGQPGRTFIGVLTTKNLLIAGEGGVHTNDTGKRVALLRAYDKRTGEDVGAVEMPEKQTGSPMTYMINGKQYIVLAVSGNNGGGDLLAYALAVTPWSSRHDDGGLWRSIAGALQNR